MIIKLRVNIDSVVFSFGGREEHNRAFDIIYNMIYFNELFITYTFFYNVPMIYFIFVLITFKINK